MCQFARHTPMNRLAVSLLFFLAIGLAREAAAVGLAYEGFQYVAAQPLPTMAGGFGWAPGGWTGSLLMVDQPPTLSYPTALGSTGDALLNPEEGEAFRPFAALFNNMANDVWLSFQEETLAIGSGALLDLQLLGSAIPDIAVYKDAIGAITLNGIAAGFSAGIGSVDFFVLQLAQFSGGVSVVNLFVDPGAVLGPPSASFAIPTAIFANQIYYVSNPGQLLDEIRVGTTLGDVAAAVPEPSTFAMLAGALLLQFAASARRLLLDSPPS
jgi:hypothetical protein